VRLVEDPHCAPLRRAVGLGRTTRVVCLATEGITDPVAYQRVVGPAFPL
jgi:hypothetical protein